MPFIGEAFFSIEKAKKSLFLCTFVAIFDYLLQTENYLSIIIKFALPE